MVPGRDPLTTPTQSTADSRHARVPRSLARSFRQFISSLELLREGSLRLFRSISTGRFQVFPNGNFVRKMWRSSDRCYRAGTLWEVAERRPLRTFRWTVSHFMPTIRGIKKVPSHFAS